RRHRPTRVDGAAGGAWPAGSSIGESVSRSPSTAVMLMILQGGPTRPNDPGPRRCGEPVLRPARWCAPTVGVMLLVRTGARRTVRAGGGGRAPTIAHEGRER